MKKYAGFAVLTLFFVLLVISSPDNSFSPLNPSGINNLPGRRKAQALWGKLVPDIPNNIGNSFTSDPKTTRTISWQSTLNEGEVIIGGRHYASKTASGGAYYFHRVDISGLTPGESYSYIAGYGSHYSPVYSFKTESSSGEFTILHITDPQLGEVNVTNEAEVWMRVIESARRECPEAAFAVNTGDIVSNAKEAYIPYYFDYAQNVIAETAFIYSLGNNDSPAWYSKYFYTPDNGGGLFYSFDYGNAHFISVDSNVKISSSHLNWLENDLKKCTRKWKVVMTHQGDYGRSGKNTALARLFDLYNVDLVLMGHNHFYARSKPIDSAGKEKNNGTVWTLPNTAGVKFNSRANQGYLAVSDQPDMQMFSKLRFTDSNIYLSSYTVDRNGNAKLHDSYSFR